MRALFFGSIGTLSDTSELQRDCFNAAFRAHGLNWHWGRAQYRGLLRQSGGRRRIELQAQMTETEVDAREIHATKVRLFQEALLAGQATLRPGVNAVLSRAKAEGMKVGLVSTTSRVTVMRLLESLGLMNTRFDIVVTEDDVSSGKPAPDCYHYAAALSATAPADCMAIEDNTDGCRAAIAAGIECLAWPGENNLDHDFKGARLVQSDPLSAIWAPEKLAV